MTKVWIWLHPLFISYIFVDLDPAGMKLRLDPLDLNLDLDLENLDV